MGKKLKIWWEEKWKLVEERKSGEETGNLVGRNWKFGGKKLEIWWEETGNLVGKILEKGIVVIVKFTNFLMIKPSNSQNISWSFFPDDVHVFPRAPDDGPAVRQHAGRPADLPEAGQEALHLHPGRREPERGPERPAPEEDGAEEEVLRGTNGRDGQRRTAEIRPAQAGDGDAHLQHPARHVLDGERSRGTRMPGGARGER
ncbi:hypothetical protein AVEN_158023-1 [Araneus ventricosus]|uniref:Uncharacterized protein n=1 Tax=Araneus ventricosus TaxID=182803 RepID=A0A4Y2DSF7_ARAVE|nr:hypothetical protein AVEN_158023-1 [Araneus ventricosus]